MKARRLEASGLAHAPRVPITGVPHVGDEVKRSELDSDGHPPEPAGPAFLKGSELRLTTARHRLPLPPANTVFRKALVDRLLASKARLVLAAAPAGAGKSTSLAQWLRADPRPSAWLRLDERDRDARVLLWSVATALKPLAAIDARVSAWLALPVPPAHEAILPSLAASVAQADPFILALDDAQILSSPHGLGLIALLYENLPDGARLALGSRAVLQLPLGRWRAAGDLLEIGAADLAFSPDEAAALTRSSAIDVTLEELDALLRQTDGWVTAVSLACLTSRGRPVSDWLPRVRGTQHEIAAYLVDEVLRPLPEDLQEFLLATSILDPLSAGSCAAVSGRSDSQELLIELVRRNVFLAALDDADESFHYQQLFRELLRAQLEVRHPERLAELHRRASDWYGGQKRWDEAARHSVAAGDIEKAGDLSAACWTGCATRSEMKTVEALLTLFTREQILAHPGLTLIAGWAHLMGSDDSSGAFWRQRAADLPLQEVAPQAPPWWHAGQTIVRASLGGDSVQVLRAAAERAANLDDLPSRHLHQLAVLCLGVSQWLCGDDVAAADTLEALAQDGSVFDPGRVEALGVLALIAQNEGRWEAAASVLDRAISEAAAMGLATNPQNGLAITAQARRLARAHDPGARDAAAFLARLSAGLPPLSWMNLLAQVTMGEVSLDLGDVAEAARYLDVAEDVLAGHPDVGVLADRVSHLGDAVARSRDIPALSAAEERVADLLPTHLTSAQMAARLDVATPTVKSQLASIYRKLGVGTRGEAVDRAVELGLLPRV